MRRILRCGGVCFVLLLSGDLLILAVYMHQPYPYWVKGKVCLLGDAGEYSPPKKQGHH